MTNPANPIIEEETAFTIRITPARKMMEIELRGFWDVDTYNRFKECVRRMMLLLPANGCPIGQHLTLIDLSRFDIQSQGVVALLGTMATEPSTKSRRSATILSRELLKGQARRAAPDRRLFDTREEAMAWLLQPD